MKEMPGCEIIKQNIQEEHIHILVVIPPKYALIDVVGEIKQYTASKIKKKFAWLEKVYWKGNVAWSPGYFVTTVGLDEKQISEYVKWQRDHSTAFPANSGPLSIVITLGKPLVSESLSETLTTLTPPREVSTSIAGHARVKLSTIVRARKRRPVTILSETKSMDQCSLGLTALGLLRLHQQHLFAAVFSAVLNFLPDIFVPYVCDLPPNSPS